MEKREIVLYIFSCLSDVEYQRKAWGGGEFDMYFSSFGEAVNSLDDLNFFDDFENKIIRLTNYTDQNKLANFLQEIVDYEEPNSVNEMLEDVNWLRIVDEARQIHTFLSSVYW